jgi:hypothetical protein
MMPNAVVAIVVFFRMKAGVLDGQSQPVELGEKLPERPDLKKLIQADRGTALRCP